MVKVLVTYVAPVSVLDSHLALEVVFQENDELVQILESAVVTLVLEMNLDEQNLVDWKCHQLQISGSILSLTVEDRQVMVISLNCHWFVFLAFFAHLEELLHDIFSHQVLKSPYCCAFASVVASGLIVLLMLQFQHQFPVRMIDDLEQTYLRGVG